MDDGPDGKPADSLTLSRGVRGKVLGYLPNALTLAALACGLASITFSGQSQFGWAVGALVLAAIFDVADGACARYLDAETTIGADLDSMADLVNFGVAPAVFVYQIQGHVLSLAVWSACAAYTIATALRLARFNSHRLEKVAHFTGVPSPLAALCLIGLASGIHANLPPAYASGAAIVVTITLSGLMLSHLRVPKLAAIISRLSNS